MLNSKDENPTLTSILTSTNEITTSASMLNSTNNDFDPTLTSILTSPNEVATLASMLNSTNEVATSTSMLNTTNEVATVASMLNSTNEVASFASILNSTQEVATLASMSNVTTSFASILNSTHEVTTLASMLNVTTFFATKVLTSTTEPPTNVIPCDNPRNLLPPGVAESVDLVVFGGILPVLVLLGVITNSINMAVFSRQGLSDRINLCLFSLALADVGFLLFLMTGKCYPLVSLVDREAGSYWQQRYSGTVLGTYLAFLITSNTVTALIALERCVCVVFPLKAKVILKTKYLGVVIVVMAVYSLVVKNTALSLKYQTVKVPDPSTNASTYISHLTPFYLRHKTVIDIVYSHLLSVSVPALSLVVVVVCTSVTIFKLRKSLEWRHKSSGASSDGMTSSERTEAAVTRMLLSVCALYVICITPSVTRTFVLHQLPGFLITGHLCNTFKVTTAVVHLMEAFNASANFLIYLKQSSKFRSTLMQMCGRRRKNGSSRGSTSVSVSQASHMAVSRTFSVEPNLKGARETHHM